MTIYQTKNIFFNKKIKMLLFLFTLIWSLKAQQNINGKLSTYDIGVVKTAASPASVYDTTSINSAGIRPENIAQITTSNDKNQAASSTSTSTATKTTTTNTLTAGNKGQSNNDAATTIYDIFNENDKNSHKLPQNVDKRGLQQPKMINMNTIRSASSQLTSSSATRKNSAEATKTAVTARPPAESMLVPKDQFNKKICNRISRNIKNEKYLENQPENTKETESVKVKLNDSRDRKTVHDNTKSNSNNFIIDTVFKNKFINVKEENNQVQHKPNRQENHKIIKKYTKNYLKPGIGRDNAEKLKTYDSISHVRQELILQFALKFKQIPRATYFTCKKIQQSSFKKSFEKIHFDTIELVRGLCKSTLMLKVVFIDHLVNKNHSNNGNNKNRERFSAAGGASIENAFPTVEWLERILQPDTLRQIVVLNLNCGLSSRRLLQMASNKTFFNSMYHWLLLEDYDEYIFNRQTEIDDADDIENKMNSFSYSYNTQADKSFKEEIVNDSNTANLQVKKLSTYPADVDGVFTSGSNPHDPTRSTATHSPSISSISLNQQQRNVQDKMPPSSTFNASRAGKTDENDVDIIEKFLEKLNININTELILAKRRRRFKATPSSSSFYRSKNTLLNHTPFAAPSPPPPPLQTAEPKLTLTNFGSMVSHDYNSLQKMDYYLLYDVWNAGLQYGGKLNITECGNFTHSKGLKLDKWFRTTSTTRRRLNMQLARIRCMVVITHKNRSDTLENYLTSHYDTHLDSMNRFNFALLKHVRDLFNFSLNLSETSTWGYLKNGKFDGMIGALVRKQTDIGGSPIFFRIERAKVIDYTSRTWVARPCFIFRHPSSTKNDRIVFLQPFSNEVWILLFVSGCLTIILLWLLTCLEHKLLYEKFDLIKENQITLDGKLKEVEKSLINTKVGPIGRWFDQNKKKNHRLQGFALFFESIIFYIGAICQQGLMFSTFFFSGRCIVITSLLFSFAIYQFYSASIVGTLLMEKPKTIRTLRDLIHSSLEIGIEDIVYNRDYFLRTKDPDAQELYAKKVSNVPLTEDTGFADAQMNNMSSPTPQTESQKVKDSRANLYIHKTTVHAKTNEASKWYDPDYGVTKIKKGGFAFHVDVATAYKIIADTFTEKEICDLAEIQLFPPQKMVSIVQKGSPLRKAITYGLRRVHEVGLTDYQRKVWHSPKPRCVKKLHTDDLRVDMQTFTSALLVLIFGYAVSLLILSLEIVHFKLWQRYTTLRI